MAIIDLRNNKQGQTNCNIQIKEHTCVFFDLKSKLFSNPMMVGSRLAQGLVQPPLQLLDSHLGNNSTYSTKLTYQANQKDKSLKNKFVTHQPPPSC